MKQIERTPKIWNGSPYQQQKTINFHLPDKLLASGIQPATLEALSAYPPSLSIEPPTGSAWERLEVELDNVAPKIVAVRRHLHQHPELSLQEFATIEFIREQLELEQVPYRIISGKRGLLVDLGPASSTGRIGMRADCDALPIQEENDFPYTSKHPGVMHACGHDAHTAMLLGAILALHRAGSPIPVRGIFQPAEEAGDGALGMIADGAIDGVGSIIALHVDPNMPVGQAAAVAGSQSASCQDFQITVTGRGGHAARPHLSIDPIAISAALITQVYQAIPRGIDSRKPVVISICQMHAGHATNVIPDTAELGGTIRSLDAESAKTAMETLERVCEGIGTTFCAKIHTSFERGIPGVVNDPAVTALCASAAQELFGQQSVLTTGAASLGAEDFADYLQKIPGCMMRLGVKHAGRKVTPLHTPTFDLDESALVFGARLLIRSLLKLGKT